MNLKTKEVSETKPGPQHLTLRAIAKTPPGRVSARRRHRNSSKIPSRFLLQAPKRLESDPKAVPQSLATQMVANAMAVSQQLRPDPMPEGPRPLFESVSLQAKLSRLAFK